MSAVSVLLTEKIKDIIKKTQGVEVKDLVLEHPANEKFGDFATSIAMSLAKKVEKDPWEIAQEIAGELKGADLSFESSKDHYPIFSSIEAVKPGFVNLTLSEEWLKEQITEVLEAGDKYGSSNVGQNKNIIIEYSQPNPNKPMHIGHARNNFLGSSLAQILKFVGYNVTKMNYMNDWGTHICKSMLMYQKYGNDEEPNKKSDHLVGDFYIMYEKEHGKNPESLETELAEMFKKMESGDAKTLEIWKKITEWAYKGWEETYKDENVSFDTWVYHSNYTKAGKEIVGLAIKKGIAKKDKSGAVIAKLEKYGMPDKVMLRSDGTSIYITQDTQLAKDNYEKYNFDKRIYVVDSRQSDYFRQLFKVLELLVFEWAKKLYHLAYGWVSLPEGAMSSRTGAVVNADDVFKKLNNLERDEVRNSIKEVENLDTTSRNLALAAFRYGILKIDSRQDIVFDYAKVTKFEGNTGPYLMYTYARAKSILEKAGIGEKDLEFSLKKYESIKMTDKELALVRAVYKFPEVVIEAANGFAPHVVANYLYETAQRFNSFYADTPVLNAKGDVRSCREGLVKCLSVVMKNGLGLLGIKVVEKM
ncbi:arginine--tRNA ligase [Patescibacteria group bacterium]|nr:arginine--tRNA ligase [Patescibacteria group bacterium]